MPLLSIIIPVYNVAEYLDECIKSCLSQDLLNWEMIIVDDGSTDSSGMICERYAAADTRIRVIHTSNGGQSRARNIALDIATGEYITFIDSDDYLSEECILSKCLTLLEQDWTIDIVQFSYLLYDNNNCASPTHTANYVFHTPKDYIENLDIATCKRIRTILGCPWAKIYRRSLFENVRFPEGVFYEDTYLLCNLFEISKGIQIISEVGYAYRCRQNSTTRSTQDPKKRVDRIKMQLKVFETLNKYSDNVRLKADLFYDILGALSFFKFQFPNVNEIRVYEKMLSSLKGNKYLAYSAKTLVKATLLKLIGISGWTSLQAKRFRIKH